MSAKTKPVSLFDRDITRRAVGESFRKLSPRLVAKNPVMFVVEVGSALTTLLVLRDIFLRPAGHAPIWFTGAVSLWLWFTVLFANFAEAAAGADGRSTAPQDVRKKSPPPRCARATLWSSRRDS